MYSLTFSEITERKDLGAFALTHCSHCKRVGKQNLIQESYFPAICTIKFWFPSYSYFCKCPNCTHEILMPKTDISKAFQLLNMVLQKEVEGDDALAVKTEEFDFDFLRRRKLLEEFWPCKCGEDVPIGFEICWRCGCEHPDPASLPKPDKACGQYSVNAFGGDSSVVIVDEKPAARSDAEE